LAYDSEQKLRAIGDFLGVAEFDWINGLTDYDYGISDGRLGPLTSAEGYWTRMINLVDRPAEWDWSVAASALTLPLFVAKNLVETSRDHEGSLLGYYTRWMLARDL
jgi:hypothetical protein